MTKPGDPGHAAAARADAERASTGGLALLELEAGSPGATGTPQGSPRAGGVRAAWTLRRRLLALVAGLLIAMGAVIGVATVTLFHASSVERLDSSLRAAAERADGATGPNVPTNPGLAVREFLSVPGQPDGTLGAIFAGDQSDGAYISQGQFLPAGPVATAALGEVPLDRQVHTVTAGGLGDYRSLAVEIAPDVRIVLALPLDTVSAQTTQLAITVAVVALGGLLLALAVGPFVVRRALQPLERVTETAQAVSERPLDRGDVDLTERVPVDDERTEVGRLGTAFNRMLGHVASALTAREHSERKVRRFVADASHELRTPLASIRGYAELTRLHGGELPPDVTHAISRIEAESVRMTELVEDLLLLARLDEGRELAALPVDLERMLGEAVGDAQAAGPDHDWEVRVTDAATTVVGDEPRLRQVVTNLLANARVHTPEGTHVVASIDRERVGGDDLVVLRVTDDGPGIPPELLGSLFERFARGDSSRSRRAGSTGLGLAIVRAVVEAHAGRVDVESEPGSTVFTVRLPAAPGE
ncbi:sensor histidine kinase [Agromyces sp. NPDC058110]|uniref:sensor histidine kinase n=1 Tax=Agromyces sp. NPDC058110 TaxID=3346345 RepID=UPI0036DF6EF0